MSLVRICERFIDSFQSLLVAARPPGRWLIATRASGLMLLVLSACSPSTYLTNVKQSSLDTCIRKSCTGAQEARDYQSCEAACRERFGQ
jgi:hypothetical protein